MSGEVPTTGNEGETGKASETEEHADEKQVESTTEELQGRSQLAEIRQLIQTYVKEEIRKIQGSAEEQEVPQPQPQVEKHRSAKSSSTKVSKPHTPK